MKRSELQIQLEANGVRADAYDLAGDSKNESYVLREEPFGWSVFYSERGQERDVRTFATEDEACEDLLARLTRDPTTR